MHRYTLFLFALLCPCIAVAGWFLPVVGDPVEVGTLGIGNRGYANEGLASDGTYFYTSRGFFSQEEWLVPYGERFSTRGSVIDLDYDYRLRHVGDIAISNGVVYIPVSDYVYGGKIEYVAVGVYSARDETLLEVVDLSSDLDVIGPGDLAGVEVRDRTLMLLEYQTRNAGIIPRIWRASLAEVSNPTTLYAGLEFDPDDYVEIATYNANGAAVQGNFLLVSFSAKPVEGLWTNDENGYIDVYLLDEILDQAKAYPVATFSFDVPEIHAEGITYFNDQLWTAQDKLVIQLESPSMRDYRAQDAPLVKHWENEGKRRSDWFGWFEIAHDDSVDPPRYRENWLYHYEHGWLYIWENSQDLLIYYDYSIEKYAYTSRDVYPNLYIYYEGGGDWVFYYEGGYPGSRWFYSSRENAYLFESQFNAPKGFASIPSGTFTMGSPRGELSRYGEWETQHTVTLTRNFYLKKTEVTKAEWDSVRNEGPELGYTDLPEGWGGRRGEPGENHPVTYVSWLSTLKWLNLKSELEGLEPCYTVGGTIYREGEGEQIPECDFDASGYRLPTEAEWEYACRAGTTTAFYNGEITHPEESPIDPNLDEIGWYKGNSDMNSHPVGKKQPNAWGLYDMSGNVAERCWDFLETPYPKPAIDPVGLTSDPGAGIPIKVIRGGSFTKPAKLCRSACRVGVDYQGSGGTSIGFRPARTAP